MPTSSDAYVQLRACTTDPALKTKAEMRKTFLLPSSSDIKPERIAPAMAAMLTDAS
jgi:hypothetical protein